MRVLPILLLAAAPAVANDLIETKWMVAPDGSVWVWPNREFVPDRRMPAPLVGAGVLGEDPGLPRSVLRSGGVAMLLVALPGGTDRASLTDAEAHFEKLGLGTTDEDVLRRIESVPERAWAPAQRRAGLDRLLAVRLAGRRKLAAAVPVLNQLAKDPDIDPFLRRAAMEEKARLAGEPSPGLRTRSLLNVLPDVPRRAQVVVLLDQRKVPRWTRPWTIAYEAGLAHARRILDRLGSAETRADRAHAQHDLDGGREVQYEIARQLGNHRIDWAVLAFWKGGAWAQLDGAFEIEPLGDELRRAEKWVHSPEPDRVRGQGLLGEPSSVIDATPDRVRVRVGGEAPGGDDARLAEEGILDEDAVWVRVRDPGVIHGGPFLAGVEHATLRVRFEGGVSLRADLVFESPKAAASWPARIRSLAEAEDADPFDRLLRGVKTEQDGARLRATLAFEGKTPEQLLVQMAQFLQER